MCNPIHQWERGPVVVDIAQNGYMRHINHCLHWFWYVTLPVAHYPQGIKEVVTYRYTTGWWSGLWPGQAGVVNTQESKLLLQWTITDYVLLWWAGHIYWHSISFYCIHHRNEICSAPKLQTAWCNWLITMWIYLSWIYIPHLFWSIWYASPWWGSLSHSWAPMSHYQGPLPQALINSSTWSLIPRPICHYCKQTKSETGLCCPVLFQALNPSIVVRLAIWWVCIHTLIDTVSLQIHFMPNMPIDRTSLCEDLETVIQLL